MEEALAMMHDSSAVHSGTWTGASPRDQLTATLQALAAEGAEGWTELWGTEGPEKLQRMRVALYAKFSPNQMDNLGRELLPLLEDTGVVMLVEHCPKYRDSLWADGTDGTGKNWLGKLLMEVRSGVPPEQLDAETSAIQDSIA